MPLAASIQTFHRTTRRSASSRMSPISTASKTASSRFCSGAVIRGRHPSRRAFDEFAEEHLQGSQRGYVHEHGDVAADVALADGEVDVEEHHDVAGVGRRLEIEENRGLAAQDLRQRHLEIAL